MLADSKKFLAGRNESSILASGLLAFSGWLMLPLRALSESARSVGLTKSWPFLMLVNWLRSSIILLFRMRTYKMWYH